MTTKQRLQINTQPPETSLKGVKVAAQGPCVRSGSREGCGQPRCRAVTVVFLPEVCSVDCGTHGVCIAGACRCEEGWTGAACDQRVCHPRCIEHGTCKDGKCECQEGWNGEHCTIGRQTTGTETGTYCFIFINRRSIVTVAHCNWLFLQGHACSPTFPLPLQISRETGKSKNEGPPLEKGVQVGRKGIHPDKKIYPNR